MTDSVKDVMVINQTIAYIQLTYKYVSLQNYTYE